MRRKWGLWGAAAARAAPPTKRPLLPPSSQSRATWSASANALSRSTAWRSSRRYRNVKKCKNRFFCLCVILIMRLVGNDCCDILSGSAQEVLTVKSILTHSGWGCFPRCMPFSAATVSLCLFFNLLRANTKKNTNNAPSQPFPNCVCVCACLRVTWKSWCVCERPSCRRPCHKTKLFSRAWQTLMSPTHWRNNSLSTSYWSCRTNCELMLCRIHLREKRMKWEAGSAGSPAGGGLGLTFRMLRKSREARGPLFVWVIAALKHIGKVHQSCCQCWSPWKKAHRGQIDCSVLDTRSDGRKWSYDPATVAQECVTASTVNVSIERGKYAVQLEMN